MDQLAYIAMGGIIVILGVNCYVLWNGLRALEDQVKLMRETLQLEIHAIRDLMEETEQGRKQRDPSQ